MKLTPNFQLQEFVHADIYNVMGDRCVNALNGMLANTCQDLRDEFGPITINDWMWGGKFVYSGLRPPNSDIGAEFSAHRFGFAADLKFKDITAIEVQEAILKERRKFPYIIRIENAKITKTWLHIETSEKRSTDIRVFNP